MATSNITGYESSVSDGMPVECYKFTSGNMSFLYTSRRENVMVQFIENGLLRTETYHADFINRGELEPGSDGSQVETTITVARDNAVAMLYQGAPPENPVTVKIIRAHAQNVNKFDVMFFGWVTQASFEDSECTLSIQLESWLNKEIPNGLYQYSCNNVLFDHNCRLNKSAYEVSVFLDKSDGLSVYSNDFANYPDGYFDNGRMYFDGRIRMIAYHKGNMVKLRYPFHLTPRNNVIVVPGCDKLFKTCVEKFNNSDNFTGFPYCPPTDHEKNPTGVGVYWVDGNIVVRDTNGFIGTTTF